MLIIIVCFNGVFVRIFSIIFNIENFCKIDYNKKIDFYLIIFFVNFILNII